MYKQEFHIIGGLQTAEQAQQIKTVLEARYKSVSCFIVSEHPVYAGWVVRGQAYITADYIFRIQEEAAAMKLLLKVQAEV